jgi:hypothetical protein
MKTQTKMILGMMLSIVAFGTGNAVADEAEAVAKVEQFGGTVRTIAKDTDEKEAAYHLSSQDVTDEALEPLKELGNIVWLNLRGTKITDAGLAHLSEMKSLKKLHLEKTSITDEGLKHLAGLENLEYLNLYETKVSDQGLEHLKGLAKLEKLYVWQTDVTKAGAETLLASLPALYINRGADAEPGPPTQALAMGRYVKVRLEGEKRILSLAEVQVIETATGKELQSQGTAIQSSDYPETDASRAKDGNVDGVFTNNSVSHTNEENNPWWLLDLGDTQDIGKLVIHNRADCCGDRLQGAIVEIFDRSLAVVWSGKIEEAKDGSVTEFQAE